jgi:hypothetical protein
VPEADIHGTTQNSLDHKGRCGAAPGRRRQNRLMTATPMLNAAAVVANHACFRHQPSFLASRRLRRISCANAFLRGLTSLGSRLLRSSIDHLSRMRFYPARVVSLRRLGRPQALPDDATCDLLLPDPRAEGAPNGSYGKDEIEPGRLVMAARSIRSVRLSLTNSEQNDEGVARPKRVPLCALRRCATGN